jgi:hypothetical protein
MATLNIPVLISRAIYANVGRGFVWEGHLCDDNDDVYCQRICTVEEFINDWDYAMGEVEQLGPSFYINGRYVNSDWPFIGLVHEDGACLIEL